MLYFGENQGGFGIRMPDRGQLVSPAKDGQKNFWTPLLKVLKIIIWGV